MASLVERKAATACQTHITRTQQITCTIEQGLLDLREFCLDLDDTKIHEAIEGILTEVQLAHKQMVLTKEWVRALEISGTDDII